jgi:hypothetical protein
LTWIKTQHGVAANTGSIPETVEEHHEDTAMTLGGTFGAARPARFGLLAFALPDK